MSTSTLDRRSQIHRQRQELTRRKWLDSISLLAILAAVLLILTTGLFGVRGSRAPLPAGAAVAGRPAIDPPDPTPLPEREVGPKESALALGGAPSLTGGAPGADPTREPPASATALPTGTPAPTATMTPSPEPTPTVAPLPYTVAIIAGHRNNDSGAICETGPYAGLWEVNVTTEITAKLVQRLKEAGYQVVDLDEFDPRLHGLKVDALLSIHIDSCVDWPGTTGYKLARSETSAIPEIEDRLVGCLDARYGSATQLPHHPTSITHHMMNYHAFRKVELTTPAAIIELGFLYHDHELLTQQQDLIAEALKEGIDCFLLGEQ